MGGLVTDLRVLWDAEIGGKITVASNGICPRLSARTHKYETSTSSDDALGIKRQIHIVLSEQGPSKSYP